MSRLAQEQKEKEKEKGAEIYNGDELCQEKSKFLLKEVGMPNGLLPLEDIIECGYVEETGYVWLKQRKKKEHLFEKIGKLVSYAPEVTAYVEKQKIKKLTGVKVKELLLWVTIGEIIADEPPSEKVTFKATSGLFRTFPASAFHVEEVNKNKIEPAIEAKN